LLEIVYPEAVNYIASAEERLGKMETIITRVQKILQKEFSPREIRLKPAGRGKLSGWIISKSFEKLADHQR
jgi:hypothetical protein